MVFNIVDKNFGQARYTVMKELETHGPIGKILSQHNPDLTKYLEKITDDIENALSEDCDLTTIGFPHRDVVNMLIRINDSIVSYILRDEELNWDDFLSGWLSLLTNYINILAIKNKKEEEESQKEEHAASIRDLDNSLTSIIQLYKIGVSYTELIKTTSRLIDQARTWGDARPTSLKLSQAYLESLNFYRE